jgi:hypothetical protein
LPAVDVACASRKFRDQPSTAICFGVNRNARQQLGSGTANVPYAAFLADQAPG